jgi:hypothetical protein
MCWRRHSMFSCFVCIINVNLLIQFFSFASSSSSLSSSSSSFSSLNLSWFDIIINTIKWWCIFHLVFLSALPKNNDFAHIVGHCLIMLTFAYKAKKTNKKKWLHRCTTSREENHIRSSKHGRQLLLKLNKLRAFLENENQSHGRTQTKTKWIEQCSRK